MADNQVNRSEKGDQNIPQPQLTTPQEPAVQLPLEKTATNWGVFCHLAALFGFIFPFGGIIGPLVIWLIKKDEHPFIDQQGKAALNFQISVAIYAIISFILMVIVIGIPLLFAVGVFNLIFVILATVKASKGISATYPLSFKFIK